jgi:hypothetical protein
MIEISESVFQHLIFIDSVIVEADSVLLRAAACKLSGALIGALILLPEATHSRKRLALRPVSRVYGCRCFSAPVVKHTLELLHTQYTQEGDHEEKEDSSVSYLR